MRNYLSDQNGGFRTSWWNRATWIAVFCCTLICGALTARAFTWADAETLLQAHTKAFYHEEDGLAWYTKNTEGGKADYWKWAEQMEMVLDAYEHTTNARQLVMFTNLFRGFLVEHGTNWSRNPYNDDIM